MEHLGAIAHGTRKFSGMKYHRITGRFEEKDLYDPVAAEKVAETHAIHFVEQRREQIGDISVGFGPIVVIPFDAELFGHWWFEGPRFLEGFIRKAVNEREFSLITPSEYLAAHPTQQVIEPAASTWGENGYFEVWLNQSNGWIYPHLHAAAERMSEIARKYAGQENSDRRFQRIPHRRDTDARLADRVLKQLARELLLAQSSDWAFLMKTGTAREYATKRTKEHLVRFNRLHDQFLVNDVDERFLNNCESRDNLFPNLNWRYYA
jgi:1,4-alpha-glucan branching enzyme